MARTDSPDLFPSLAQSLSGHKGIGIARLFDTQRDRCPIRLDVVVFVEQAIKKKLTINGFDFGNIGLKYLSSYSRMIEVKTAPVS